MTFIETDSEIVAGMTVDNSGYGDENHEESELRLTDPSTCNICRVTLYTIVTVTVIL